MDIYKDEILTSRSTNLFADYESNESLQKLTDEFIIQDLIDQFNTSETEILPQLLNLRDAINSNRILNCSLFEENQNLELLKHILLTSINISYKEIISDILFVCFKKISPEKLNLFNDIEFFKYLYDNCDQRHDYAFKLLGIIVTLSQDARDFLFSDCSIETLLQSYSMKQDSLDNLLWLISCASYLDTERYPILLNFALECISSNQEISMMQMRYLTYILYCVCNNGHASDVFSHSLFTFDLISKIFSINDINSSRQMLRAMNLMIYQTQGTFQLPTDFISSLLHHSNPNILNEIFEFIRYSTVLNADSAQVMVNEGIMDTFSDIFQNGSTSQKNIALPAMESIVANIGRPNYLQVLPHLMQFLDTDDEEHCSIALRLFYRFFNACDDDEILKDSKQHFQEEGGMDLLNELLENDNLYDLVDSIIDLFNDENQV
ncbi:hypothetical protein TVAG_391310 [Trichomonas vaginalis G3]|uniref:Uncharacterized protein n=1 Tax=Trichomonas vaginalis (strain ATCC PRA-98 / G3) TaxID=412133 RepID=A2DFP4_TRIV3|nr:armadillo (ARM) repeat-containing protein family [Trichomonas vaginalis G3]EAY20747.1 hypothetical protein TVAG_391310 [Trichomonas vaginalis G3]KAI5529478.1 armadillo (ARM) repeat-containing protein family [Trichomonas vaginalis G3]|eukprot:XP_001581733.1 hypothetical protein [Trichomonas vaginalis G3]